MAVLSLFLLAPTVQADNYDGDDLECKHVLGTWVRAQYIPVGLVESQSIRAGGLVYVIGGFTEGFAVSNRVFTYNINNNRWVEKANIPQAVTHAGVAYDDVNGEIWVAGGLITFPNLTKRVYIYNIASDSWRRGPDLPANRGSAPLVKVDRTLHYIGGISDDRMASFDNHWTINLDDYNNNPSGVSWNNNGGAPFPTGRARNHASGVYINGEIHLIGGMFGHNGRYSWEDDEQEDVNMIDIYNPVTDTWRIPEYNEEEMTLDYVRSHFEPGTSTSNGRVILVSGREMPNGYDPEPGEYAGHETLSNITEYDPITGISFDIGTVPEQYIMAAIASVVDGYLFVSSGNLRGRSSWRAPIEFVCNNNDPQANNDSITVAINEMTDQLTNGQTSLLHNDTDADDDDLTVISHTEPAYGSLTLNSDGTFSYDPDDEFQSASDSFTYTISDGRGGEDTATVTITIEAATVTETATATDDDTPTATATDDGTSTATPTATATATDDDETATATATDDTTPTATATDGTATATPTPTDDDGTTTPTATATDDTTPTATATEGTATATPTDDEGTPTATDSTVTATASPEPTIDPDDMEVEIDVEDGVVIPTFKWKLANNTIADWYNLVVSMDSIVLDVWLVGTDVCTNAGCSYTPTEAQLPYGLLNGAYQWWVRAYTDDIPSEWSAGGTITINQPEPLEPTGTWVDVSTGRPILMIDNDNNTSWLNIYIGTPDFSTTIYWQWIEKDAASCDSTRCTIVLDAHPTNGDYVLYFQSWGAGGFLNGDANYWAGPIQFELNLPTPELPENMSMTGQTFTWAASVGATWYQLWIGTDAPDYTTYYLQWYPATALNCAGGGTCSVTPNIGFDNGLNYVWYLQAWGPGGLTTGDESGWRRGTTFIP